MTSSDEKSAFVHRLYFIMFNVIASSFFPVFNAQRKAVEVVLRFSYQKSSSRIIARHQQLFSFLTRNLAKEPAENNYVRNILKNKFVKYEYLILVAKMRKFESWKRDEGLTLHFQLTFLQRQNSTE